MSRERTEFYRAIWGEAARKSGAECIELTRGILQITQDGVRTRVLCNYTSLDDPVTLKLVGDKLFVQSALQRLNLPVPRFVSFSSKDVSPASELMSKVKKPCVVKPVRGAAAGRGITTNITSRPRLAWATAVASRYCNELLIEEQIEGDNYRLLYLDGMLLDAVRRDPPAVVGDGRSSIRKLVKAENQQRLRKGWMAAQVTLTIDAEMKFTLRQQGLSLSSVPEDGQRVILKTVVNQNAAHENVSVREELSPAIVASGAAAADDLGVRLAGIDLITSNIGQSLEESGGVILEVNTTPGLYHHKLDDYCPVASQLLAAFLRDARQTATADPGGSPTLSRMT